MKNLIYTIAILLLFACDKKDIKSYDPTVTETIQVKSIAMECIYQLIDFHIVKASNISFSIDNCMQYDSTHIGNLAYDTINLFPQQLCPYFIAGNSTGGYTSIFPTAYPSLTDTVSIQLTQFKTNGYSVEGTLNYIFTGSNTISCYTNNLTITNDKGSTSIQAQFNLNNSPSQMEASGTVNGSGSFPFSWSSTSTLLANNNHASYSFYGNFLFHTGKGILSIGDLILNENYGNGEDDSFSILEDVDRNRRVLNLPRL